MVFAIISMKINIHMKFLAQILFTLIISVFFVGVAHASSSTFISIWDTRKTYTASSELNQIQLPLLDGGTYDFDVDWGDGEIDHITSYDQTEVIHTYDEPGVYTLEIDGSIEGFAFHNEGDRTKILDIVQWGDLNVGNSGGYFYGCENLDVSAVDVLDLTGTTNLKDMFAEAYLFNGDISGWDVSEVTDMSRLFYYAFLFNQDISSWDVSSVTDMSEMFADAYCFQSRHWILGCFECD